MKAQTVDSKWQSMKNEAARQYANWNHAGYYGYSDLIPVYEAQYAETGKKMLRFAKNHNLTEEYNAFFELN